MKRSLAAIVVLILLVAAGAAAMVAITKRSVEQPLAIENALVYTIAPHARFSQVAADLGQRGVVEFPRLWALYARLENLSPRIKAGEYEITPGATPASVLRQFIDGRVLLHPFTIVEGWRASDLLTALRSNPVIRSQQPMKPAEVMTRLGSPQLSPEGQFLPETYLLPKDTQDFHVLSQAHAALAHELNTAWDSRAANLPLKNPEELLTLASIVEKETALASERERIAGVYARRLTLGMRLQADPTVIYGLGDRYDGNIHSVDLHTDSPYNTYTRAGLPPTPICLPGAASIRAAAHPVMSDDIFFVASGLGDGSHTFTSTLQDHNAAVELFLKRQRQRASEGGTAQ